MTVVTREPSRVINFVRDALGMQRVGELEVPLEDVAQLLGWPTGGGVVRSTMWAAGAAGLIEVVDAPDAAPHDRSSAVAAPAEGVLQVSVAVSDVASVLQQAERLGVDEVVGPRELTIGNVRVSVGLVRVAGVQFQVSQTALREPAD